MYRIVVRVDDKESANYIKQMIQTFLINSGVENQIKIADAQKNPMVFCNDAEVTDVIFLDICLETDNGIIYGKWLNQNFPGCQIVFLADSLEYASDVYAVEHTYYVLKSELQQRLPDIFRCLNMLQSRQRYRWLTVAKRGRLVRLEQENIIYLERQERIVIIVCNERENVQVYAVMKELMEQLNPVSFVRSHNSYLVNINYVDEILRTELHMRNGAVVPVSRKYTKKVRNRLALSASRN